MAREQEEELRQELAERLRLVEEDPEYEGADATPRDQLVLAIVGHLEWFLYAAAAGAWVFAGIVVAYGMVTSRGRRPGAVSR